MIDLRENWWRNFAYPVTFFGLPPIVIIPILIAMAWFSMTNVLIAAGVCAFFGALNYFGYTTRALWWAIRVRLSGRFCQVFPKIGKVQVRYKM